jgi:hypothetical protein
VWTPKRILLLMAGFAVFLSTYEVYAHFLGSIDGLPALPQEYWPSDEPLLPLTKFDHRPSEADRKLSQAFGPDCEEVKQRTIKLVLRDRGIVIASSNFTVEPDGRAKLTPFSIAIFGKERDEFRFPEINTVRCKEAYLQFDRPISNPTEISNRKIVGGELRGGALGPIEINNNRHTPEATDDLHVTVTKDPLFYAEKSHKIWTKGIVQLVDTQSKTNRTEVVAEGMDLFLTATAPAQNNARARKKPKGETISGVDRIILHRKVRMNLYVDARSGFLGDPRGAGKTPASPAAKGDRNSNARVGIVKVPASPDAAQEPVVIITDGPFRYNLGTDLAVFDIPPPAPPPSDKTKKLALEPAQVLVFRIHGPEAAKKYDQLICEHLEIQFRRKLSPGGRRATQTNDREIATAHATATGDKVDVVLALDSEDLEAYGKDLFYRAATPGKGPETILKAGPHHPGTKAPLIKAIKNCNIIQARELWLIGSAQKGGPQYATAQGPGRIDLADTNNSNPNDPRFPVTVKWGDKLTSTKDGPYDLLTLTGGAEFVDTDHHQCLRGKRLQVWLEPAAPPTPAKGTAPPARQTTPATNKDAPKQRPHRLEADQDVSCESPETNIPKTDHLTVWFHDLPTPVGQLPATLPAAGVKGPMAGPAAGKPVAKSAGTTTPGKPTGDEKNGKKPINLWARSVIAHVNRIGPKNELQRLLSQGNVHVHQEGATPKDKGVDITGDTLELTHFSEGDLLVVLDPQNFAALQLGELFLVGPKVTIDQRDNNAEVRGAGRMNMPSNTTFEGGKPTKPGTRLEVFWNKGMLFNGKDADFQGGVIACQDNARMQCATLQVTLDRAVSFKQGQKQGQAAKVENLVADAKVNVVETVKDAKGQMQKYSRLRCQSLAVDNQQGPINAAGPGIATLVQPGAVDNDPAGAPLPTKPGGRRAANAPPKEEMKLTRIEFDGRMFSNNKSTTRTAIFLDKVEVVNVPSKDPDAVVDKDHPPPRGMYLACEKLTVYSSPAKSNQGTKASQVLIAEKSVFVRTQEFQARAQKVTYFEAKDTVIFEGSPTAPAQFYKLGVQGVEPEGFKGSKIFYNRRTREFKGDDLKSISLH